MSVAHGSAGDWHARLVEMRETLDRQDAVAAGSRDTVTLDQQSVGRLSRMDALQGQAMAQATHARRRQMRARIAAALQRLDDGEFGWCEGCGEPIAPRRLELDPTLTRCVGCAAGGAG